MGMNDNGRLAMMKALGMDKQAAENFLGAGPTGTGKPASMIKKTTGPMQGDDARTSLMNYIRPKTTKASVNEQNAKKPEEEEEETKPGVVRLESDSDTPPKKAPAKKPEEPSENEVEKEAGVGSSAKGAYKAVKSLLGEVAGGVGRPIARRVGALSKMKPVDVEDVFSENPGNTLEQLKRVLTFLPGGAKNALIRMGRGAKRVGSGGKGTDTAAKAIGGTALGLGGLGAMGLGRATKSSHVKAAKEWPGIDKAFIPGESMGARAVSGGLGGAALGMAIPNLIAAIKNKELPGYNAKNMLLGGGAGALLGVLTGKEGPSIKGIGRSALTGLGTGTGAGAGVLGGAMLGDYLGNKAYGKTDSGNANKKALLGILTTLVGGIGGGALGYEISKKKEASHRRPFAKTAAYGDERKGMGTTSKVLLGALAGVGIPVALWHGSGKGVRELIEKIYKLGLLKKMHNLPSTHPSLAKGLMYAPAAAGGLAGALSGRKGDDEFKLAGAARAFAKAAVENMRRVDADQLAGNAAKEDLIPYLGPLGGKILGGLGDLTGGIGLKDVSSKLHEWRDNPTARSIAGGGTTALAAILATLVARKAFGGNNEEYED